MSDTGDRYSVIKGCRSCASDRLRPVIDLGLMPLSDGLVSAGGDREKEDRYPLTLVFCEECSLVQILETVEPKVLYGDDYPYYSSFSDSLVEHARRNVETIINRRDLDENSLVVEIASNDGYLLQWFAKEGVPVLGIDPAPGPARAAVERGIPTVCEFFGPALAQRLVAEGRRADVIVGNNVLAHVPDQNELVRALETLLAPGGTVVMEFPYVRDMIAKNEFDTIYHEHHCYFSVSSVQRLFARHGLDLVRVEGLSIHGGSLRVYFERNGTPDPAVAEYLRAEEADGLLEHAFYERFAGEVALIGADLKELINGLLQEGHRVAGYAAAAKGAILLNHFGIGPDQLEYIVDRNTHKHRLEMPGVAIPIVGVETLMQDPPDYLLILAWNFKEEILRQQVGFAEQGGRFIVPIPAPAVV